MYEDIILRNAILANLNDLQAESLLHESILLISSKDQRFTMFNVDCILFTTLRGVD